MNWTTKTLVNLKVKHFLDGKPLATEVKKSRWVYTLDDGSMWVTWGKQKKPVTLVRGWYTLVLHAVTIHPLGCICKEH